ncbi:sugar transferase [Nostoc punctiforme UO1]|uniref:sugar transferase n=1 Tax=Nostoc punctiforme TaxID=272131 RepID=UPI0030A05CAC
MKITAMNSKYLQKHFSRKNSRLIKSILDRFVAAIALLALSPVILIIAIAIYFRMGYPVIFIQPRPGKNARIFNFYKFRTMTDECDAKGNLLPDEKRLTPFGEFLRQTSLDELPQLWNVLKGDMSLVGPRPLLVQYLDRYSLEQARRHNVKPGITGWAQINGRRLLDGCWEEKFRLDIWYIDNWNLWLDLKILVLTLFKVWKKENISQEGYATGEEFQGSTREV